ncbi:MAG: chloramphenicol phosphotransferase CPT family protein [Nocardioidaceae bacterium]
MPAASPHPRAVAGREADGDPARGRIIFLNGATSSGKTSIAEHLLALLDAPYFYLQVDAINAMRARPPTLRLRPEQLELVLERTVLGFHRAVAGMAAAGNPILVDHVLREPSWLLDCLALFAGGDVVFVGVHCPLAELERRERARGDRELGRVAYHFARVHRHGSYDVEVDTSTSSPHACAVEILDFLARPVTSRAFDQLRKAHLPACPGALEGGAAAGQE